MNLHELMISKKYITLYQAEEIFTTYCMQSRQWEHYDDITNTMQETKNRLHQLFINGIKNGKIVGEIIYTDYFEQDRETGEEIRFIDIHNSYIDSDQLLKWAKKHNYLKSANLSKKDNMTSVSVSTETHNIYSNKKIIEMTLKAANILFNSEFDITKEVFLTEMKNVGTDSNTAATIWKSSEIYRKKGGPPALLHTIIELSIHAGIAYAENKKIEEGQLLLTLKNMHKKIDISIIEKIVQEIKKIQALE